MKKIVITSILKPVTEVRMYERFALSLAKTNKYEINIIGIKPKNERKAEMPIRFHYLKASNRSIISRMGRWLQAYNIWLKIRPHLIIVTVPELIPIALLFKFFYHSKLIYDVQENYERNIIFQGIYKQPLKTLVLLGLRFCEWMAGVGMDNFILAEKCYENQTGFHKQKYVTLENKTQPLEVARPDHKNFRLLFTGIISNYSGIHRALMFYRSLKRELENAELHIVGFSYHKEIRKLLLDEKSKDPMINLTGIDYFVDHREIVKCICSSDLGIICHEINRVSEDRKPTKLFEYAFYSLPYVVQCNTRWSAYSKKYGGGIEVDFDAPDIKNVLNQLKHNEHDMNEDKTHLSSWVREEPKLLDLISNELK